MANPLSFRVICNCLISSRLRFTEAELPIGSDEAPEDEDEMLEDEDPVGTTATILRP
jgi:hypothetical protein